MSNHTGTVCACQDCAHPPRPETTPPLPSASPDNIDRRLLARYGAWLLTGGYTALPTYAWVYYARLGVSEAEMVCIAQLCTYWWSARDPFPGEAALATRMGKTVRTIQGYLRSLEGKGLLHIQIRLSTNGRQSTNAYDLRPFFAAVEGLARLDGLLPADDAAPATPATSDNNCGRQPRRADDNDSCNCGPFDHNDRTQAKAERESLCAEATIFGTENRPTDAGTPTTGEDEGSRGGGVKNPSPQVNPVEVETFDSDSTPPTPTYALSRPPTEDDRPPFSVDPDEHVLAAEIATLGAALGDDAPASSIKRAYNLWHAAGGPLDRFMRLVNEAATRTRARQESIVKRRRDGQAINGMPYLFAVLQDLLHPAPRHSDAHAPDRGRRDRSARQRRRPHEDPPPAAWVGWTDSPARLPITESNPVWRAVLDELAQVVTVENFNTWLASTRVVGQEGEQLRIAVPTVFNKQWLEGKLHGRMRSTLGRLGYGSWQVEYVVEAATCVARTDDVTVSL